LDTEIRQTPHRGIFD